MRSATVLAVLLLPAAAQELPTVLDVQVENSVLYVGDVTDLSRLARSPVPVAPVSQAQLGNFTRNIFLADVTAINGTAAKGQVATMVQVLRLNTAPPTGAAIADANRPAINHVVYEFLKADGVSYGTLWGMELVGAAGGLSIIGGTGAFLGARGSATLLDANPVQRVTSQAEDPSMHRANGGGRFRSVFQIFPMFRPAEHPGDPQLERQCQILIRKYGPLSVPAEAIVRVGSEAR